MMLEIANNAGDLRSERFDLPWLNLLGERCLRNRNLVMRTIVLGVRLTLVHIEKHNIEK